MVGKCLFAQAAAVTIVTVDSRASNILQKGSRVLARNSRAFSTLKRVHVLSF